MARASSRLVRLMVILGAVPGVAGAQAAVSTPVARVAERSVADSVVALQRLGREADALAFARRVAAGRPDDADAQLGLALAAYGTGALKVASEAADRLVELAPDVSRHQLVLAQIQLTRARKEGGLGAIGKAKRGRRALERAIELDPRNFDAREWLVGYYLQAPGFVGGDEERGRREAIEAMRLDPVRGRVAWLQVLLDDKQRTDEALATLFDGILPHVGSPADSLRQLSLAALGAVGAMKDSAAQAALVAKAFATHPNDPYVRYQRARFWVERGTNLEQAEALLQEYLREWRPGRPGMPHAAGAHWRLGQIREKQGRSGDAIVEYRTALRLQPSLRGARQDLERLEKRR